MMRLRVVRRIHWTVLAIADEQGRSPVVTFLEDLSRAGGADAAQVQSLITLVARNGPPRNEQRSRRLEGPIWELKTRSGIRIPYLYDEGMIVICTEALRKPKRAEPRRVTSRALALYDDYQRAKRAGDVRVLEEEE